MPYSSAVSDFSRATAFIAAFARRQAAQVVDVPGGFAVLSPAYAGSYLHNKVILTKPAEPAEVLRATDEVLGGAGHLHRQVDSHVDLDPEPFRAAGYEHSVNLVMRHTGADPDRPADPGVRVEEIDLDTMVATGRREWRAQYPTGTAELVEQLATRREAVRRGADEVTFLGVRDGDAVIAHADLYLDVRAGIAQIEDVETDPEHRNRGLARAVLAEGLRRARAAGVDLVFLVADEGDWPHQLYGRLGYQPIGRIHELMRLPEPVKH